MDHYVYYTYFTDPRKKKGTEIGSGKPGQARVKAMEKREKTLLVEYLAKNKANVVRDRRIGVRSGDQVCSEAIQYKGTPLSISCPIIPIKYCYSRMPLHLRTSLMKFNFVRFL